MRNFSLNLGRVPFHIFHSSRQKKLVSICIIVVLLYLFLSYAYHDVQYSCKNDQYKDGTGSILQHQRQFDQSLLSFLSRKEIIIQDNEASDWVTLQPHVYAYSAFISESAVPPQIKTRFYLKILAVVLPSLPNLKSVPTKLSCLISFSDGRIITTTSYISILPEHHKKCYRAAFITCPVATHAIPSKVSLTSSNYTGKWINVQSALLSPRQNLKHEISLCVRPLYGPYNSIIQIAEFISYYQTMGVTRFLFYNYTITPEVSKFIQMTSENTTITFNVLPWSLSSINMDEYLLHSSGQMVFNQDCILRSISNSRYVLIVDLDEFVMPQETLNLGVALRGLEAENPGAGSFLLPAIMFCEELLPKVWVNKDFPLLTQEVIQRQQTPWMHTYRSKYVVMPQRINIAMIHEISEHVEPFYSFNVPHSKILLYHCRQCCSLLQPWFYGALVFEPFGGDEMVIDGRMRKIAKQLNESPALSVARKLYKEVESQKQPKP